VLKLPRHEQHASLKMKILTWICLVAVSLATVIGIDFGTDFLKVSVIKPGGNIQTVLNRESKRKTVNQLTIRDSIRYYGVEAQSLVLLL
jgi:hypoxia up-regulated 1